MQMERCGESKGRLKKKKEGRAPPLLLRYAPATAAAREFGLKTVRIRTLEH